MRRTATLAATLAGLLLVATAACGVPADNKPRAISKDQIPSDAGANGGDTAATRTRPAMLYYTNYDGERTQLVPVAIPVPVSSSSATPLPAAVLDTLLSGIPEKEAKAKAFSTNIPDHTSLASQPSLDEAGVLTVDLNPAIFGVRADGARLAFGQIVCTADALAGVDAVRFEVEGKSRPVPMGDGEASSEPLTCKSYENLTAAAKG